MICTIYAPWFGPLPFYADSFLSCCAKAPAIQWVINSDQPAPISIANNILWLQVPDVRECIRRVFKLENSPARQWRHKLCDLKPFWNRMFTDLRTVHTEYRGWIDWDVYHDLSRIEFNFMSAKFTRGLMASPLFIQKNIDIFEWYPIRPEAFLRSPTANAWDELDYLRHIDSTILQHGMTPHRDLRHPVPYALHLFDAKRSKSRYTAEIERFFKPG